MSKQTNEETGTGLGTSGIFNKDKKVTEEEKDLIGGASEDSSGPVNIGGSSATQTSAPVKAMPKQQKAGTGTFANLKSYLQAAQGGGQQRVAQAAAGQIQRLGAGAQKATQQAQKTFGTQMGAGSGAVFQGAEPGKYLTAEEASGQAKADVSDIVGRARATTYQAPQQAQVQTQSATQEGTEAPVQAPATPAQPQQYFTPEQTQRFADIINAQYQGPQSLQQAGLYDPAAQKARTAQQAGQLTQTALGREQLLRDVFGRGRDYTRGASKLDSILLNTSSKAIEELQKRAEPALQSQQALQAAQNLSANEAAQRASAIEQIRSGARTEFTEARTAEEQAAQDYIQSVQENWNKLPEYFQNVMKQSKTTSTATGDKLFDYFISPTNRGNIYNLSEEEAQILGLTPGQGLFGITPESIQAAPKATGAELITKNQLAKQLALAQLAELDKLKTLQKNLLYSDLEKAGTKDILSSLDTQKIKAIQEENRRNLEKDPNLLKTSSIGTTSGYKPFDFYDVLKSAGYTPMDLEGVAAEGQAQNLLRDIAEGKEYVEGSSEKIPTYLENVWKNYFGKTAQNQLGWRTQDLQKILSKYGGLDTSQIVENEQTKVRSEALRKLLGNIYKNE